MFRVPRKIPELEELWNVDDDGKEQGGQEVADGPLPEGAPA